MKIYKFLTTSVLTVITVVLFPFYLTAWILCTVIISMRDFRIFFIDFAKSIIDSKHTPIIGLSGYYALNTYRKAALQAEIDDDIETAAAYWELCALLYDTDAMLKIADYTVNKEDLDDDSEEECRDAEKLAIQWYAIAASFNNTEAESLYESAIGQKISAEEKAWFRRNFIKERRNLYKKAKSLLSQKNK